jgi:cellobiose phosphorylase
MTAGRDAPTRGEGKNSWLTGTVAWSFVVLSQYILGIRPDYDGLLVDPCIPDSWQQYTVSRKYKSSLYTITINNPRRVNKGLTKLQVDGKVIKGNKIPDFDDHKEHTVVVEMG